jgi:glycosyltransferase involved in cell wall biosynthesis
VDVQHDLRVRLHRAAVLRRAFPGTTQRTVNPGVSAVIPSIGRPSLGRAVQSVLGQTRPVAEIIVVADTDAPIALPPDDRIVLLRTDLAGRGPARARQRGIDAATGSVIALLDDDDEWYPSKLERQLEAVDAAGDGYWIASSRISVLGPGTRRRMWPRRVIRPGESVTHADAPHDEPSWLIRVQRTIPDVRVVQVPDALSTYNVEGSSVSRDPSDRIDEYIDWGLQYLAAESSRVLGDYLCTSPVSAAVSARSLSGLQRSLSSALRYGRPGPFAMAYAMLNAARIVVRSAWPVRP